MAVSQPSKILANGAFMIFHVFIAKENVL